MYTLEVKGLKLSLLNCTVMTCLGPLGTFWGHCVRTYTMQAPSNEVNGCLVRPVCVDRADSGLMSMPCTVITTAQCAFAGSKAMLAKNCPERCGLCTRGPTAAPTAAPTGSPTALPSASPTGTYAPPSPLCARQENSLRVGPRWETCFSVELARRSSSIAFIWNNAYLSTPARFGCFGHGRLTKAVLWLDYPSLLISHVLSQIQGVLVV